MKSSYTVFVFLHSLHVKSLFNLPWNNLLIIFCFSGISFWHFVIRNLKNSVKSCWVSGEKYFLFSLQREERRNTEFFDLDIPYIS